MCQQVVISIADVFILTCFSGIRSKHITGRPVHSNTNSTSQGNLCNVIKLSENIIFVVPYVSVYNTHFFPSFLT